MTYAPGAPRSIWSLSGISDGAKLLVMYWWAKADHDAQQHVRRCTVWAPAGVREDGSKMTPTESLFADMRGGVHPDKADRTLRGYVKELGCAGLAYVDGRCIDLVPPAHASRVWQDPAEIRQKSAGENLPEVGRILPEVGKNLPEVGRILPNQLSPPVPPNSSPVSQPGDARARDSQPHHLEATTPPSTTSPTPNHQPTALHPHPPPTETPQERHQRIREAQGWNRNTHERPKPTPVDPAKSPLPQGVQQALSAWPGRGGWQTLLENPAWEKALCEAVERLDLDGPTVVAVLEHHDAERARLKAEGQLREAEGSGRIPSKQALWWAGGMQGKAARVWLTDALAEIERRKRALAPAPLQRKPPKVGTIEYEQWSAAEDEKRRARWRREDAARTREDLARQEAKASGGE